ncbi:MAG: P-II family nitrogen regulator [Methanomicrobiales archaeon]
MSKQDNFQIIFAIVEAEKGTDILKKAQEAGAEGGTVFFGRGTGIHEHEKILGIPIEPAKEIIMILIKKSQVDAVLEAIMEAGHLEEPGKGLAFVLDVSKVVGICHHKYCSIEDEF